MKNTKDVTNGEEVVERLHRVDVLALEADRPVELALNRTRNYLKLLYSLSHRKITKTTPETSFPVLSAQDLILSSLQSCSGTRIFETFNSCWIELGHSNSPSQRRSRTAASRRTAT